VPITHQTEGWPSPNASVDNLQKRKIFGPVGNHQLSPLFDYSKCLNRTSRYDYTSILEFKNIYHIFEVFTTKHKKKMDNNVSEVGIGY
jgi:hypothetical protein